MELARSISLNLVDITGRFEKVGNDSVWPFSPDSYSFCTFQDEGWLICLLYATRFSKLL